MLCLFLQKLPIASLEELFFSDTRATFAMISVVIEQVTYLSNEVMPLVDRKSRISVPLISIINL